MRWSHLFLALLLAGCTTADMAVLDAEMAAPVPAGIPEGSCEGPRLSQCKFINSPVKLSARPLKLPGELYPYFKTKNQLEFSDAENRVWIAPAGILTDGASIPVIFVPFFGSPRDRKFLNAATVHDSYCAKSNRNNSYYHAAPWQDVHRMFYDALLVSGTNSVKAKIMYAAVYLGGPRWKEVRSPKARRHAETGGGEADTRLAENMRKRGHARLENGVVITAVAASVGRDMQSDTPLPSLYSRERLIAAFRRARSYIQANDPPIQYVEAYLTRLEQDMAEGRVPPARKNMNFRNMDSGSRKLMQKMGGGDGGTGGGDNSAGGGGSDSGAGGGGSDSGAGGGDK